MTSGTIGRIIELGYAIGDEDLGVQRCDGLICATPQGSTAYNLSNGGPVLVWGLEAMVLTFVAPHTLHVRPLVVPRGADVTVTNRSRDVATEVIVDGHAVGRLEPGDAGRRSPRRAAEPARDAARGDVLQSLRDDVRPRLDRAVAALVVGCACAALALAGAAQTRQQAATVKVAFLQGEQLVLVTRAGAGVEGVAAALLAGPTAAERKKDTRTRDPGRRRRSVRSRSRATS